MVSHIIETELRIDHECLKEEKEDNILERGKDPKSCGRWIKGRLAGRERMRRLEKLGDYGGTVEEG